MSESRYNGASATQSMLYNDSRVLGLGTPLAFVPPLESYFQSCLQASEFLVTLFNPLQKLADGMGTYGYTVLTSDGSKRSISINLPEANLPACTEDFYQLAAAILHQQNYLGHPVLMYDAAGNPLDFQAMCLFATSLLLEAAVAGHDVAKNQIMLLQIPLPVSRLQYLFVYKSNSMEKIAMYLPAKPVTAEHFYALAHECKLLAETTAKHSIFYFDYNQVNLISNARLLALSFNLLNDAAEAGHAQAQTELIDAMMEKNP